MIWNVWRINAASPIFFIYAILIGNLYFSITNIRQTLITIVSSKQGRHPLSEWGLSDTVILDMLAPMHKCQHHHTRQQRTRNFRHGQRQTTFYALCTILFTRNSSTSAPINKMQYSETARCTRRQWPRRPVVATTHRQTYIQLQDINWRRRRQTQVTKNGVCIVSEERRPTRRHGRVRVRP